MGGAAEGQVIGSNVLWGWWVAAEGFLLAPTGPLPDVDLGLIQSAPRPCAIGRRAHAPP
jgi:hypothetical protein